jgi:hypothetical protein
VQKAEVPWNDASTELGSQFLKHGIT